MSMDLPVVRTEELEYTEKIHYSRQFICSACGFYCAMPKQFQRIGKRRYEKTKSLNIPCIWWKCRNYDGIWYETHTHAHIHVHTLYHVIPIFTNKFKCNYFLHRHTATSKYVRELCGEMVDGKLHSSTSVLTLKHTIEHSNARNRDADENSPFVCSKGFSRASVAKSCNASVWVLFRSGSEARTNVIEEKCEQWSQAPE